MRRHTTAQRALLLSLTLASAALAGCTTSHELSGCGPCATECCPAGREGELLCVPTGSVCNGHSIGPADAGVLHPPVHIDAGGPAWDASAIGGDAAISCEAPVAFDRSCSSDGDCVIGQHQLDCCGTQAVTGVSVWAIDAFDAHTAACDPLMPECDCIAHATQADDGSDPTIPGAYLHVACEAGTCSTSYVGRR